MHMADALISPAVGGALWVVGGGLVAYSARKLKGELEERKVPLMGVLGAFVFAAQMINFTIPATGSSGHIGGGMLLAILLGPYAAFITIASVLAIQALFFADGGLLALGCNIVNIGFFPCFIAYPFIYRRIVGLRPSQRRILAGTMISAIVGLQLGAFSVVLETVFSGISELSFGTFLAFMQPIHLAIGAVEGLITSAVVSFVWKARPEILELAAATRPISTRSTARVLAGLGVATLLTAGVFSWFASARPDGLEWSIARVAGTEELPAPQGEVFAAAGRIQETTSLLPDYGFRPSAPAGAESPPDAAGEAAMLETAGEQASVVSAGTSAAGLVGAGLTLGLVFLLGVILKIRRPAS